jgi:hypothetical protein
VLESLHSAMSFNPLNGIFRLYYRLSAETPYRVASLPKRLRNVQPRLAMEIKSPWYVRHFFALAALDGLLVCVSLFLLLTTADNYSAGERTHAIQRRHELYDMVQLDSTDS